VFVPLASKERSPSGKTTLSALDTIASMAIFKM